MNSKTDENLEVVFKAIAEIAERLDRLENAPQNETFEVGGKLVVIDTSKPLVEQVRRKLVETTLDTSADPEIRGLAVAKLDAYSRKDQHDAAATKAAIAKTMQGDWQKNSDAEMFGIEGSKPQLDHVLAEIRKEVGFARSKFPGDNVTFAALVEEVGELATATFSQSRIEVRKEAVQVAAMAIRLILDGDCTFDAWRSKFKLDPLTDRPTGLLTACRACGHTMPRKGGGRPAPTVEQRLAVALLRQAVADGHKRGPMPEPLGRRNLSKKGAKVLAAIKRLAADKKNATEIAAALGCSVPNVRRYAHDYGVRIVKGESGPAMNGKLYTKTTERLAACREVLKRTTVVAEVAEALGVSKATAREYMKRCRDLGEVELPGFEQRKASGFAYSRRKPKLSR